MQSNQAVKQAPERTLSAHDVVFSVYFHAAGMRITNRDTQASILFTNTIEDKQHIKLAFDGSAITHGLRGVIWGAGLNEQSEIVKNEVLDLLSEGKKVTLNCYGVSRGAIAALLTAKLLENIDENELNIHLALIDPVPGNFLFSPKLDFLGLTLTNQAIDLTASKNLKKVLALYANSPLPARIAHAPLFPQYPANTEVTEEVIPGYHIDIEKITHHDGHQYSLCEGGVASLLHVSPFLQSCGTQFALDYLNYENSLITPQSLIEWYNEYNENINNPIIKNAHSKQNTYILTTPGRSFINHQHFSLTQQLQSSETLTTAVQEEKAEHKESYALAIEKRMISPPSHPLIKTALNELTSLYQTFLHELLLGMSAESLRSRKGELLKALINKAESSEFPDEASLKNALRVVIALALQRERHALSIFSTSRSGYAALNLLRQQQFQPLTKLILGCSPAKLSYRDLRILVLGEDQEEYFSARHHQVAHQLLENISLTDNTQLVFFNRFSSPAGKEAFDLFRRAIHESQPQGHYPRGYMSAEYNLARALCRLKQETFEAVRKNKLSDMQAKDLAQISLNLVEKFKSKNLTFKDINIFEQKTAQYAVSYYWRMILGAVIGAAVGILIGAMLGIVGGPTAAITAIYGGTQGAILGASLGASAGGVLGTWLFSQPSALSEMITTARIKIKSRPSQATI